MKHLGPRFGVGVVIVLIGALLLVDMFAGLHLPIIRTVVALVIILIGAKMIAQSWARRDAQLATNEAVLANLAFSQAGDLDRDARFDVVLGRGIIDMTRLAEPTHDVTITVDTLFGRSIIKLPPAVPCDIEGSATFGQVRLPDRSATTIGNVEYHTASEHPSRLHLRVHAVFGTCEVIEAAAAPPVVS